MAMTRPWLCFLVAALRSRRRKRTVYKLHCRCLYGHASTVSLLLDRGAAIEAKDNDGSTSLMASAAYGHASTVSLLLDRGAAIEAKEKDGATSLIAAAALGHALIVSLLLDRGAVFAGPLAWRVLRANLAPDRTAILRLLLDKHAPLAARYVRGLVSDARSDGHYATVALLLSRYAAILPPTCYACGDGGAKLSCARCKVATYCSAACQRVDWSAGGHKSRCVAVAVAVGVTAGSVSAVTDGSESVIGAGRVGGASASSSGSGTGAGRAWASNAPDAVSAVCGSAGSSGSAPARAAPSRLSNAPDSASASASAPPAAAVSEHDAPSNAPDGELTAAAAAPVQAAPSDKSRAPSNAPDYIAPL